MKDFFELNQRNLEGKLFVEDFKVENLPETFINFCSLIAKNAHFYQTRSKTGEYYGVHLDEVAGIGSFCVKKPFKAFTKKQLELHDWDEDVQDNKDNIYNLTRQQKQNLGLPNEDQHVHFSPLFSEFDLLGQFTAQTVRLFNKKRMLNYLDAKGIINLNNSDKELFYLTYIISLTGAYGFPTILGKQPRLNIDLHSFFLSLGKIGDLISNMDIGKPFNFNYQKNRLHLSDEEILKNHEKYLNQKKRNSLRVLEYLPILENSLFENVVSQEILIEKNLKLISNSAKKFAQDYLREKIEY